MSFCFNNEGDFMMFQYQENALTIEDIKEIRQAVEWKSFSNVQLDQALEKTIYSLVVKDGDQSVAMGRLIGDGIYYLICDVAVIPAYQHQGIATKIIEMIIQYAKQSLSSKERCSIQLIAASGKESFYEKLGFALLPNALSGHGMQMFIKK